MKRKTTISMLILVNLFVMSNLKAQYKVTTSTGTYTELASPTIIASGATFNPTYVQDIAGAFRFFDKNYGLSKSSGQGTNVFPAMSILAYESPSSSTVAELTLFGNCSVTGKDATSSISYLVTGDTKTGIIKFQWKNLALKKSSDATDYINVQLWLSRADTSFTYVIGPHQINGTGAFGSAGAVTIGIDDFDGGFNSILASAYLKGDPANPTVVTGSRSFTTASATMDAVPASGTMYKFKYPHVHTSSVNVPVGIFAQSPEIFPNPASESVHVRYTVSEKNSVRIAIMDMMGREVKTITNETKSEGNYENEIEVGSLRPGVYFCSVSIGGVNETRKLIVSH